MGDDIGSGSVTDCLLRSFSDLKIQTELHYLVLRWLSQKPKQTEPEPMSLPLNHLSYSNVYLHFFPIHYAYLFGITLI